MKERWTLLVDAFELVDFDMRVRGKLVVLELERYITERLGSQPEDYVHLILDEVEDRHHADHD